ncbi:MAG: hypothetical protein KDA75_12825 [Planctomycetaceae bacterium]|nr:hypothetical protein [Planctomycetaceae bacterium]
MTDVTPESEHPWRLYLAVGLFVLLVAAGFFFAGGPANDDGQETEAPTAVDQQRLCEDQLAGIMAAVDPRALGLSSSQVDRAHDLNLWKDDCGAVLFDTAIAQDEDLATRLLSEEVLKRFNKPDFTPRDVAHLRTTMLLRRAAEHVVEGEPDALRQAVRLFDFVQRNVLEIGQDAPTLTPYEILLLGRGSAEQRTWLLAELLRQIELDAVILQPKSEAEAPGALPWLVGVIVEQDAEREVYLFDPAAGIPIPAASEQEQSGALVTTPATLTAARENADVFAALDLPDNPYRFRSEDLSELRIGLIGNSSLWSNRMASLDFATEISGAIFYDGLGKNRLRDSGLYDRVASMGETAGWTADGLFIWDFPESELTRFGTPEAKGPELLANYMGMLSGPVIQEVYDPESGGVLQWDHPLVEARHMHITGIYSEAIREYNQIRGGVNIFTPTPGNDLCRETAVYWTTCCQYELGAYDSVVNTGIGGQYPPPFRTGIKPIWAPGMALLSALSLAQLGAYAEGSVILSQLPVLIPHGQGYLVRRWQRLAQAHSSAQPLSRPNNESNAESPPAESSGETPATQSPPSEQPAENPAESTPESSAEPNPAPAAESN